MGHTKRKNVRHTPQMRSRTTRSKGKPMVTNPEENSQMLNAQLRELGLYAAHTIGDGNCLFRAMSDQLYGTPAQHLKLRADICNWIEDHKERYGPFVEDERGLDHHLSCMRQQATYGGHLELSAFAHMTKRNVKVIQPGLVYVIEWDAGGDLGDSSAQGDDGSNLDDREKRRLRRERRRSEQAAADDTEPTMTTGTVYVAYHDWEHFSSIRNLQGPHVGLPNVVEASAPDASLPPFPVSKKPASKVKAKIARTAKREAMKTVVSTLVEEEDSTPLSPSQIPLPGSASPSPPPSSAPSSQTSGFHSLASLEPHAYRSPKRTFDESSASSQMSESSQSVAKRAKSSSRAASRSRTLSADVTAVPPSTNSMSVDADDLDTPDLSAPGSSAESVSSLSSVPSPAATPPPPDPPVEKRLTRRQRKVLGVPKARPALVGSNLARTRSAGKIVIPGGKSRKVSSKATVVDGSEDDPDTNAEWRKNGTGRLDVRGFRELKI
ncbi:cysteine proteinase [Ganoderma leucocontextum]|nr:cysteine proteinase [Ganoderma leucocontextum]